MGPIKWSKKFPPLDKFILIKYRDSFVRTGESFNFALGFFDGLNWWRINLTPCVVKDQNSWMFAYLNGVQCRRLNPMLPLSLTSIVDDGRELTVIGWRYAE